MAYLSDCPQILTAGRLTHYQQKSGCELFLSKYFINESDFCTNTPYLFIPISKMSCSFSLKLNMANRRHVFLEFLARKLRNILNKRKIKFAPTCNVQEVIRAFVFRSRGKFDNSFLFKIVCIV